MLGLKKLDRAEDFLLFGLVLTFIGDWLSTAFFAVRGLACDVVCSENHCFNECVLDNETFVIDNTIGAFMPRDEWDEFYG